MKKRIDEIINIVLANRGKNTIPVLHDGFEFRKDLGFDSLDLAELTVRIEAEFGIDIFDDGIVNTIGEILEKIEQK